MRPAPLSPGSAPGGESPDQLDEERDHGNHNDGDENQIKVLLHKGDPVAQKIAQKGDSGRPQHPTDGVEHREALGVHPGNTNHHRDKGTHNRDETGQNQCPAAVLFKKSVRTFHMAATEKPRIPSAVKSRTGFDPNQVADLVTKKRTDEQQKYQQPDIETDGPRRDEQTGRNSRESPGRKNPINNPVSAKIIVHTIRTTHGPKAGSSPVGAAPWTKARGRAEPVVAITAPAYSSLAELRLKGPTSTKGSHRFRFPPGPALPPQGFLMGPASGLKYGQS